MKRRRSVRQWARRLKHRLIAVAFAVRDPRTPWFARAVAIAVVAYAASPIDLIPDFIPVLGYLDDLILLPLGIVLVIRLIPREVMRDAMRKVMTSEANRSSGHSRIAAGAIVAVWIAVVCVVVWRIIR